RTTPKNHLGPSGAQKFKHHEYLYESRRPGDEASGEGVARKKGGRMSCPRKKFIGYLGRRMQEHLDLRRSLGRHYVANEGTLLKFNHLIHKDWPKAKTVTREMVMAFLRTNRHLKTISRK